MSSNNTRDPHHNVWGGKNNTWGNRNRKKKSPTVPTDAVVLDADMRNGCGAVEHRTALRPSTTAHSPRGGGWG